MKKKRSRLIDKFIARRKQCNLNERKRVEHLERSINFRLSGSFFQILLSPFLFLLPSFFSFFFSSLVEVERRGRHARALLVREVGRGAFALKSGICKICAGPWGTLG